MLAPYIGINDFMYLGQVEAMLKFFKSLLPIGSNRLLHIGTMMSYKTLNEIDCVWLEAFAPKERLAEIYSLQETYNCLHYASFGHEPSLRDSLSKAIAYGGPNLDAIQLDMTWPDPEEIQFGLATATKPIEIILQIGTDAMEQENDNPSKVAQRLKKYDGLISRILLDKSMGKGLGMDAVKLIPFARAISDSFPELGLGAAGGLGPDTMHLILPLLEEFPDLSFDAQSKLHPNGNILLPVDWDSTKTFLLRSLALTG